MNKYDDESNELKSCSLLGKFNASDNLLNAMINYYIRLSLSIHIAIDYTINY